MRDDTTAVDTAQELAAGSPPHATAADPVEEPAAPLRLPRIVTRGRAGEVQHRRGSHRGWDTWAPSASPVLLRRLALGRAQPCSMERRSGNPSPPPAYGKGHRAMPRSLPRPSCPTGDGGEEEGLTLGAFLLAAAPVPPVPVLRAEWDWAGREEGLDGRGLKGKGRGWPRRMQQLMKVAREKRGGCLAVS